MNLKRFEWVLVLASLIAFSTSSAEAKPYQKMGTHAVKRPSSQSVTSHHRSNPSVRVGAAQISHRRTVVHRRPVRVVHPVRHYRPYRYVRPVYVYTPTYYEPYYEPYWVDDPSWTFGVNSDGQFHLGVNF